MTVANINRPPAPRTGQLLLIQQRADKMAEMFMAGASLDRIARQFGTNADHVKSSIRRNSSFRADELLRRRHTAIAEHRRRQAEKVAKAGASGLDQKTAQDWSDTHLGAPLADGAATFGVGTAEMAAVLGPRKKLHGRPPVIKKRRFTDEQMVEAVRHFLDETGQTSCKEFDIWAKSSDGPSHHAVINRLGGWNIALKQAGMTGAPEPIRQRRRHTDNDLWAALVEFLATQTGGNSVNDYRKWAQANPGVPSFSLLRDRLGRSWVAIRQRALRAAAHDPSLDPAWVADVTRPRQWCAAGNQHFARSQALATVRAAIADLGPRITYQQYRAWRKEQDPDAEHADASTLLRSTGMTWRALVLAAGGDAAPVRHGKWTDKQVAEAIRTFLDEHPNGSSDKYRRWSKGQPGRPSAGTVIEHFQTWRNAVDQVFADNEELAS